MKADLRVSCLVIISDGRGLCIDIMMAARCALQTDARCIDIASKRP